jgi:hypothetical protein
MSFDLAKISSGAIVGASHRHGAPMETKHRSDVNNFEAHLNGHNETPQTNENYSQRKDENATNSSPANSENESLFDKLTGENNGAYFMKAIVVDLPHPVAETVKRLGPIVAKPAGKLAESIAEPLGKLAESIAKPIGDACEELADYLTGESDNPPASPNMDTGYQNDFAGVDIQSSSDEDGETTNPDAASNVDTGYQGDFEGVDISTGSSDDDSNSDSDNTNSDNNDSDNTNSGDNNNEDDGSHGPL